MLNIGYWLYKRNISASELARKAEVNINTVVNAKNGKRIPHRSTLNMLAKALDIEYKDLFIDK